MARKSQGKKNISFGPTLQQRTWTLLEALIDHANHHLTAAKRISNLAVKWVNAEDPVLEVQATLESLQKLFDLKANQAELSCLPKTRQDRLGEILLCYLSRDYQDDNLGILEDLRVVDAQSSNAKKQGLKDRYFRLHLWGRDKSSNKRGFEDAWQQVKDRRSAGRTLTVTAHITGTVDVTMQSSDASAPTPSVATQSKSDVPLTGRVHNLASLPPVTAWEGRDQVVTDLKTVVLGSSPPQVMVMTGQGGIGKSSLALKLLEAIGVDIKNHELTEACPFARLLCVRLEEGDSFEEFTRTTLGHWGKEVQQEQPTPEQLLAALMQELSQERYLLVLDNLETLLQPASQEQAGRCESSDWGKLLGALANNNHKSLALITSRELPLDLADPRSPSGTPNRRRVKHHPLEGISEADSVALLQELGLEDSDEDLQWIAERVQGQVLVLTLLADIALDQPGYLRQNPQLVTASAEPVLREQLQRLDEAATELLKRMAVLRYAVDIAGLTFLRFYADGEDRFEFAVILEEPAELTDAEQQDTETMVRRLVRSSLVQERYDKTRCRQFYDLHRVVSDFLKQEYAQDQPNLLKTVYQFYRTGCTVNDPKTLDDLRPILEAQHFAMQLGNTDEAFRLLDNQLWQPLQYWGYWALLRDLYSQIRPKLEDLDDYRRCMRRIGCFHRDWGDWDTAERYFQDSLNNARQHDDQWDTATSLGMLGDIERKRGNWDAAEQLYRQSLEIREALGDRSGMASSYNSLGYIKNVRGDWNAAEELYQKALKIFEALGDRSGMATSYGQLGDIERYRGNWDAAEQLYRQSLEIREALGDRSGMATSYGCLGDIERYHGNWDAAEHLFRQCLEIEEALGDRSGMATSYGQLGDIERNRGNWDAAEQLYRQSLKIAEELGDRSWIAGVRGSLGEVELGRGNLDKAEELLKDALNQFELLGNKRWIPECNFRLAQVWQKRGNLPEAETHYAIAHQLFTELGAMKDLERIEREWETTP